MSVKDIILLSDTTSNDPSLAGEAAALYFSACAEQGSEHPIAKGILIL